MKKFQLIARKCTFAQRFRKTLTISIYIYIYLQLKRYFDIVNLNLKRTNRKARISALLSKVTKLVDTTATEIVFFVFFFF